MQLFEIKKFTRREEVSKIYATTFKSRYYDLFNVLLENMYWLWTNLSTKIFCAYNSTRNFRTQFFVLNRFIKELDLSVQFSKNYKFVYFQLVKIYQWFKCFSNRILRKVTTQLKHNNFQLKRSCFSIEKMVFNFFESDLVSDNLRKSISIITTAEIRPEFVRC